MSAIVRPRARLVLRGLVVSHHDRFKKDTAEHFATEVVVQTPENVALRVTAWDSGEEPPKVGSDCAIWVTMSEGQYGAELSFDSVVSEADLDALAGGLRVLSGK